MERVLDDYGFEGKYLKWCELPTAANLDIQGDWNWRTVQRALHQKNYHKCIAYRKGWVDEVTAKKRYAFAEDMLRMRPDPADWEDVRYSDECHFGYGPNRKAWIIRKPGTRYCSDCIQREGGQPKEENQKRHHVWAAVGYTSSCLWYSILFQITPTGQ